MNALRAGIDSAGDTIIQGSPNVFVNGAPSVRIGDRVKPHQSGIHRNSVMATGSSTVFVNGIPKCRVPDVATCGHVSSGGSNVFVG